MTEVTRVPSGLARRLASSELGGRDLSVVTTVYPASVEAFRSLSTRQQGVVLRWIRQFAEAGRVRTVDELFEGVLRATALKAQVRLREDGRYETDRDSSPGVWVVRPSRGINQYCCDCVFTCGALAEVNAGEYCRHILAVYLLRAAG